MRDTEGLGTTGAGEAAGQQEKGKKENLEMEHGGDYGQEVTGWKEGPTRLYHIRRGSPNQGGGGKTIKNI